MARALALGLRARLALALGVILTLALSGTFVAVYRGTGSQVRGQVDQDLGQDLRTLERVVGRSSPGGSDRETREFLQRQPSFGPSARLYVVRVAGGATITNEPELLGLAQGVETEREASAVQRAERAQGRVVLGAGPGLHTLPLFDAGAVRFVVKVLMRSGGGTATLEVGEPLGAVRRAQEGVRHAFLVAVLLALPIALLAGFVATGRISRRLRDLARTAARVDAGELHHRIRAGGVNDEARVLADAFDHMLDRLRDAFDRQRAFVGDASHELRTPLAVIGGQLEVLARQPNVSSEDVARVSEIVSLEIARMKRLIDDLLVLASADEGRPLQRRRVELAPFLGELLGGLRGLGDRRFEHSPFPAGSLHCDADRLAQVIGNLVHNAVVHTQPGGVLRLAVSAAADRVTIAVEDDGPGIPLAERERIFDRFHRIDAARTREEGGSGLGLAIAAAIVAQHGGRIWAGEAAAGGARVALELPGFSAAEVTD